ncbi:MAG: spore germination protein [Thermaerobacter sp.]|nr:spore germination protein [Thermaerobacter sp.]
MDPKQAHEVRKLAKILAEEVDGWVGALDQNPTAPVDEYVDDVDAAFFRLKSGMGRSSDILLRRITVPASPRGSLLLASVDGLADTQMVDQDIIAPLLTTRVPASLWDQAALTPMHITRERSWPRLLQALAAGNTLLFAPDLPFVWVIDTVKYTQRSIERPQTELAVRGPEEAFNEILLTQKNQIRRRLLTPDLLFRDVTVGRLQHTTVAVAYLEQLTNPSLVQTVIERLESIAIDGIANATTIAGLIRDHPRSIFPTIRSTERVDVTIWRLLEGAVVVLTDGDPFVLIAPAPLIDFYRTGMDYSSSWSDSSFVRLIRLAGWSLGLYLPALYVAFSEVNPNVLPTSLFIVMQGSHAGLPFPPVVEIVVMILVIETLRESAIRLPKVLSTTLGTVGAIVVGTAVVKAGLVDAQIIVVMTMTALSIFSTPVYELTGTWRVVGFIFLMSAAIWGVFGIAVATIMVIAVLIDMQTFGTPYFAPWAPLRLGDWSTDALIRAPWTMFQTRWRGTRSQRPVWRTPAPGQRRPHLRRHQGNRNE